MDNDQKKIFEAINQLLNVRYRDEKIKDLFYHMPVYDLSEKYMEYTISEFIILCRINYLFENGFIVENKKHELIELFELYRNLNSELGAHVAKIREMSEEKFKEKSNLIIERIISVERIFHNFHLLDSFDLTNVIVDNLKVEDENLDVKGEIKKIKVKIDK